MAQPSLYVHIPFCRKKCGYCDFFSLPGAGEEAITRTLEGILAEVEARLSGAVGARNLVDLGRADAPGAADRAGTGTAFPTVFIGGGTPTAVPAGLLAPFLERLSRLVFPGTPPLPPGSGFEWTVECNPESLSREHLDAFKAAGVTRVSLGIQSLRDRTLRLSGRLGTAGEARRALALLAEDWTGGGRTFGCDFIAGLPGETASSLVAGLRAAVRAGASHVSLYSLTVEEGTAFGTRAASDPGFLLPEEARDELWFAGRDYLEGEGLGQYEVSNFAAPGAECLHNLGYWDLLPYFGAGPGAVSTFPCEGGGALRIARPRDIPAWLAGEVAEERLEPEQFLLEQLLMSFRTARGLSTPLFRARFGAEPEERIGETLAKWRGRGLLAEAGDRIALKKEGLLILNRFLVECAEELG
jgi:oxygen-independent coproporphyrinogen III oxidase